MAISLHGFYENLYSPYNGSIIDNRKKETELNKAIMTIKYHNDISK